MIQKHIVAWAIILVFMLTIINQAVIVPSNPVLSQSLFTLLGAGYFIFGTWAAIILLKSK